MYWLRWHYHVKDIAGAQNKIRQKKTNKRTEALTVQYNHDRLVIVKRRPKKYSLQLATERRQRRCIPDRRRQAVPRTCRWRHGRWALNVWWTVPPAWLCQQNADGVEYRHQISGEGPSKIRRRCSMKTAVGQNAQPECDSLRNCCTAMSISIIFIRYEHRNKRK